MAVRKVTNGYEVCLRDEYGIRRRRRFKSGVQARAYEARIKPKRNRNAT